MTTAFILLGAGYAAILLEFFLPGAVLGTIGALFVLGSILFFALNSSSPALTFAYTIAVALSIGFLVKFALWSIRQGVFGKTFYSEDDQAGFIAATWDRTLVGREAVVSTDLKPGGHVFIDGKQYSALSQSGYIVKGEKVAVIGGEGETLIVKQITKKVNP